MSRDMFNFATPCSASPACPTNSAKFPPKSERSSTGYAPRKRAKKIFLICLPLRTRRCRCGFHCRMNTFGPWLKNYSRKTWRMRRKKGKEKAAKEEGARAAILEARGKIKPRISRGNPPNEAKDGKQNPKQK